ncbi:amino acid adenylation domain-containing protein [Nitrosomonas sp. JL21]|uniref:non-ribosomal peptide synthetase n=1 Tax=Nitrosomonas sp. JL21 TaxID=153949 RepID=UPI00136814FA|nr:non-ribosomal peptide synthetase [Nitrosomonas sp. JL21]MBL8498202.1 amino acid adenylation domain-containing protein [Nitrosomonas sp.]MXS79059.1 amino acid adenylation domain-containing protein [Nitrosomonas sp. JL21]
MNTRLIPNRAFPVNLVTHLQELARVRPEDTALITVSEVNGVSREQRFDYRQLDQRAKAFAAELQGRMTPGERVLLLMENDEYYVIGFLACLYSGLIAVPVFPPESIREQHMARLRAIAEDARAQYIITTSNALALLSDPHTRQFTDLPVLTVDTVEISRSEEWRTFEPCSEDIAFLQYTSGSTAIPKGVMVSHHNLMVNARAFEEGMSICADDIFVSWLPLYHDMGLIGGLLQPLHRGVPVILTTPKFFIERPVRWLEIISRYRATVSGAPNFAFQLCVERVRDSQLRELDLSSWRVAFCGAEPIRRDTLQAFTSRFASAGFSAGTIYPCYGLAEATLFVTGGMRGEGMKSHEFSPQSLAQGKAEVASNGVSVVACGFPASNHSIKIIDPGDLRPLPDGHVGEIWTAGDSLAQGYWQRSRDSEDTFLCQDGLRWLRTGDLGFIHARQLYLMGRLKDLIIIRGQNLYPQDIELLIENEVDAVRKGRVAVFSVDLEQSEGIGVAVEVSRNMQKLVVAETLVNLLNEVVSMACQEPLVVVVLLNPGALPKTSSGKLQRSACRQGWLDRSLDAYAIHESGHFVLGGGNQLPQVLTDKTEQAVAAIWGAVLNRSGLSRNDHFFALGGNSLKAVQVAARISQQWGIPFTTRSLFQFSRLHECAAEIKRQFAEHGKQSILAAIPPLVPRPNHINTLPLSFGQQRLWFLWQLDPASTAYHVQHAIRLTGALDKQALDASWQDLIDRHESLRTIFRTTNADLVEQVILPAVSVTISKIDMQDLTITQQEQRISEETEHFITQPFDLTRDPLLRIALIRAAPQENILVLVMHHIVADGVSIQILLDELAICYQTRTQGKLPDLSPLPVQYGDYALWHRQWLDDHEKDRQLSYWKNYLDGAQTVLKLPVDGTRKPVTHYWVTRHRVDFPVTMMKKLRQVAVDRHATLFMTLFAAFQALLFRQTGQQDICVGVPIANRNRIETAGLIGFFVNTIVLRSRLHGRMTLNELLLQVREDVVNSQIHQDLPFEQLVEALHPQRDLRHNPLFQVTLNHLQQDYRQLQRLSGLQIAEYPLPEQEGQLEFRLETVELPDGTISGHFIYATDLFSLISIKRLASHYMQILQALTEDPNTPIGNIELLDDEEKRMLAAWGNGTDEQIPFLPAHHRIEQQAQENPQALAVISGGAELSYGELNTRANRLAHRLISLGARPEMRVGIAVARDSIELIVGLLAILKTGAGYVPLDPGYPYDRLEYMLNDSDIRLLLTQSHLMTQMPVKERLHVLDLDTIDWQAGSNANPVVALHPDHLAYVIYTSGSTGRPKGVIVAHGPLGMHLSAIGRRYDVRRGDRELLFFSMNFDAAVEQWITPLTEGATLVLSSIDHLDGEIFAELMARHQITTIHLPPAYLRMLLPFLDSRHYGVRTCISGGEAWHAADVAAVRAIFPHARLVNAYGPTETVITPTAWVAAVAMTDTDVSQLGEYAPIGRPVGNRAAYVLDTELNPVTPGAVGELYIGGSGLARGYLDRPGLTGERFIADPFMQTGGRLYRTGDLVRWRSDGQLEYLGRADQQIKLRGFRVELGEIEAQLLTQDSVREAVVIAQEGPQGLRLVAYVIAREAAQRDAAALKMALADVLPDYMLPGIFVFLDKLPLTPNGKIDRNALPQPTQSENSDYEPPVSAIETVIADLWGEVLHIPQVGLHHNFFDLGGHSLLLIKIKQGLETSLNVQVRIVDLFRYTTVASLAKFLSQGEVHSTSLPQHQQRAQRQRSTFLSRRPRTERIHS